MKTLPADRLLDFTVAGGTYLTALLISPVDPDRKIAIASHNPISPAIM